MENCESSPSSALAEFVDLFGLLPDELVTDILSRVPTQQLVNCSTVCTRWHSLLGTPSFAQEHEKRPDLSSVPLFFFFRRAAEKHKVAADGQLAFLKDSKYTLFRDVHLNNDAKKKMSWPMSRLRASYHGLLLFEECTFNSTHCILNPLTGEAVSFKNPGQVCGLYYHPPNRQYRLLCCRRVSTVGTGTDNSFPYYVCSTSQELIKEVGTFDFIIKNPHVRHHHPAVAAGSFLYWLAYKPRESDGYIMTFDVMNETLQFKPHPEGIGHPKEQDMVSLQLLTTRLFEVGTQLHLYAAEVQRIDVWALQDHKTWSWNKVFALDLAPSTRNIHGVTLYCVPLAVEDGELLYLLPGRGLFRTNKCTKWVELIRDTGIWKDHSVCRVNWRRSLVSLKTTYETN